MIRSRLKNLLDHCFQQGMEQHLWSAAAAGLYNLETPKHEGQGDFATNFAMIVAGKERRKPREVAEQLAALLRQDSTIIDKVEIAGPGFVNLFLNPAVWSSVLAPIAEQGEKFGLCNIGKSIKAMVEFVSANPTGPLTVGHGRNAVLGDSVASLLVAVGWDVPASITSTTRGGRCASSARRSRPATSKSSACRTNSRRTAIRAATCTISPKA